MNPCTITIVGLAGFALATPATASAGTFDGLPAVRLPAVPNGKIEHTVVENQVSGSQAIASHSRNEQWLSSSRSHGLRTNLETNKLESEDTTGPDGIFIWDADGNTLFADDSPVNDAPPSNSIAAEALLMKKQVAMGWYKQVGTGVAPDGGQSLILRSVPGASPADEPTSVTTVTVDADTFQTIVSVTAMPNNEFSKTEIFQVAEQLPLAGNQSHLKMGPHAQATKTGPAATKKKVSAREGKRHHDAKAGIRR